MVHPLILKKHGTTKERLRKIFEKRTLQQPGKDATEEEREAFKSWQEDEKIRQRFELEIQDALLESVSWGLRNYQFYAAVDLAWDTPSVSKTQLPLLLYAQGKIKVDSCLTQLAALPNGSSYIKKVGEVSTVDLPKFIETSINLCRSIVTRRHAAQSVKYSNLYPYYKYESRSTGLIGKLKADVMSQEAEIVVDGFGYRHHDSQVMRDGLLYGHVVDFVRAPWETYSFEVLDGKAEAFTSSDAPVNTKSAVYKEGIAWVHPHPTRLIIDNAHPISAINDDVGPQFVGYWDVVRYGDVKNDPSYYNTSSISHGTGLWQVAGVYSNYFSQYYDRINAPNTPRPVADSANPPAGGMVASTNPAGDNDRSTNIGIYSGEQERMSMFKAEYFRKLIPSNHRMGTYPHEVWVRFVVAGDSTIIYAEPMYSTPAAALSINESDSRQLNASFAHDVMWAQDMMSNLVSQMLLAVQGELFKIIGINKDLVDKADLDKIQARLKGHSWAADGPLVIPFSLKQLSEEMDIKLEAMFKIGETNQGNAVQVIFQSMAQLMSLLERLASMSPAEQGQPAPREISATEVTEMASTTQNVYSYISDAIDEYRSAKKRILYESLVCAKQSKVQVPVLSRYSKGTITKAGFTVVGDDADQLVAERPESVNVAGDKLGLIHDYVFTTRDGSERPVNTQAANTLVQLMQVVLQVQPVLEAMGKPKIYEIFNEIFRLSGTGIDLNLEVYEGESNNFGEDQVKAMQQLLEQLKAAITEIASATQQNATAISEQEAVNKQQQSVLQGLNEAVDLVKKTALDIEKLNGRMVKLENKPEIPPIQYRDAPEQIRRQIEQTSGFTPPADPTYVEEELAKLKGAKTSVVGQI